MTYLQLRASRIIAGADFLLRLDSKFSSKAMIEKRKEILTIAKKSPQNYNEMDALSDIFDFFEDLGLLLRKGVLSKELIWNDYCPSIQCYWAIFYGYINWARKADNDPTLYTEFEYLYNKINAYDEKRRKMKIKIDDHVTSVFISDEIDRLTKDTELGKAK